MSANRLSQDDYLEVGARRRGHVLVCHGDYPVLRIEDKTAIGALTSGPIYRAGMPHVSGWVRVCSELERKQRLFFLVPKDSERTVHEIHQELAVGLLGASK